MPILLLGGTDVGGDRRLSLPDPTDRLDGELVPLRVHVMAAVAVVGPRRVGRTIHRGLLLRRPAWLKVVPHLHEPGHLVPVAILLARVRWATGRFLVRHFRGEVGAGRLVDAAAFVWVGQNPRPAIGSY